MTTLDNMNMKCFTQIFSATYLLNLMSGDNLNHFKKVSNNIKTITNFDIHGQGIKDILNLSYNYLLKNYRNEYIYKNILISNIKQIEAKKQYALFSEMDIGSNSRVDIAHFSSSNHAYEIKTELDSFARLNNQLSDYKKGFEYIWTIIPEEKLKKLLLTVDANVGIKVLDSENNLILYREAKSNLNDITHGGLFSLLRQKELLLLLKMHYGHEFNYQSSEARKILMNNFKDINIEEAHNTCVTIIRNRIQQHNLQLLMGHAPNSLLPISLNQSIQKKAKTFLHFLDSSIDELDNHINMMQHRKLF